MIKMLERLWSSLGIPCLARGHDIGLWLRKGASQVWVHNLQILYACMNRWCNSCYTIYSICKQWNIMHAYPDPSLIEEKQHWRKHQGPCSAFQHVCTLTPINLRWSHAAVSWGGDCILHQLQVTKKGKIIGLILVIWTVCIWCVRVVPTFQLPDVRKNS